jgi:hypothetical protein
MISHRLGIVLAMALLGPALVQADVLPPPAHVRSATPQPATSARDPVNVARKAPAIAELIKKATQEGDAAGPARAKPANLEEVVTKVALGGQCGFAGCSSSTLVAFTYHTRGANTATRSVLALVTCDPLPTSPCQAVPAEVRPTGSANPTQ